MARKKVKLAYIMNASNRRQTFRRRENTIIKLINELSTLCGVEACAIIYEGNNEQAEVWPSPMGVRSVLWRFKSLPELNRSKKMVDLEGFMKQRIEKAKGLMEKQWEKSMKNETANFISQYMHSGEISIGNVSLDYMKDLMTILDDTKKEVEEKLNLMDVQCEEQVANGFEAVNGGNMQANMGHADVQGLDTNMNYAMQVDDQHLPMISMDEAYVDPFNFWSI